MRDGLIFYRRLQFDTTKQLGRIRPKILILVLVACCVVLGKSSTSLYKRRLRGSVLNLAVLPFPLRPSFTMFGEFVGRVTSNRYSQDGTDGPQHQRPYQGATDASYRHFGVSFSFHLMFTRVNSVASHWIVRAGDGDGQLMMVFEGSARGGLLLNFSEHLLLRGDNWVIRWIFLSIECRRNIRFLLPLPLLLRRLKDRRRSRRYIRLQFGWKVKYKVLLRVLR
jgi:hypothetical protein